MERWRNGNVTYSVNQPLRGETFFRDDKFVNTIRRHTPKDGNLQILLCSIVFKCDWYIDSAETTEIWNAFQFSLCENMRATIKWIDFFFTLQWNIKEFLGVIRLKVQTLFTIQKKSAGIMIRATPRASIRSLFERLEIMWLPLLCEYIFLLLKIILSNQNKFQQIQVYTVVIQEARTIILYKLSTSIFSEKYILCWQPKFPKRLSCILAPLMYEKALFKVTLRRLLNTHSFYQVAEFTTFQNDS
jgi:hypothetical protein